MSFKIAIIGCGDIAERVHGPACRHYADTHDHTILSACCDLDAAKATQFREAFNFRKSYQDPAIMLQEARPDAVIVCVSEAKAAAVAIMVLEHHIPLCLEKPPGRTSAETLRIMQAAAQSHAPAMVALNRRFMPLVEKLKSMVTVPIEHVRYDLYRQGRDDLDFAATAIHGIDTARHLAASDFAAIDFSYQSLSLAEPHVVNTLMQVSFESGASGQLSFCPMAGIVSERAVLHASGQTWFIQLPVWNDVDYPGMIEHYHEGKLQSRIHGDQVMPAADLFLTNGFYQEDASFFDKVRQGKTLYPPIATALQSVQVADCMRQREKQYRNDPDRSR